MLHTKFEENVLWIINDHVIINPYSGEFFFMMLLVEVFPFSVKHSSYTNKMSTTTFKKRLLKKM